MLAERPGANIRELCRRFAISPTTGYKWLRRYRQDSKETFRMVASSPELATTIATANRATDAVGARCAPGLGSSQDSGAAHSLGQTALPAASTIHAILRRHGRIDPSESPKHQPWQRFEYEAPNQLWQMDFKGHFALGNGARCTP